MKVRASYPTVEHGRASEAIVDFFSRWPDVEDVILTGSCAHGGATKDSCLDIMVMVPREVLSAKRDELEKGWASFYKTEVFKTLQVVGRYSHVDLDFVDGCFAPQPRGWTSGPDDLELEIGNTLRYSVPLWSRGGRLERLKAQWLPYYGEGLRRERLAMVRSYCLNNLDHVPLYVDRGLHFQAFNRLYDALKEFLQALFISRRTYPIAYDKWIRKQIVGILGEPGLSRRLVGLLEIGDFEGQDIANKAKELGELFEEYIVE